MKKSKIFYFDIDGTIIDSNTNQISTELISAFHTLKTKGYKLVICTGRTVGSFKMTKIQDLIEWDAYILTNGATVFDHNFKAVSTLYLDPTFIQSVVNDTTSSILLEDEEMIVIHTPSENMLEFLDVHDIKVTEKDAYNNEVFPKLTIDNINLIKDGADNPLFKPYRYEINAYGMYEFMHAQGGKHNGIKIVNKMFNTTQATMFGDGTNDIEALQYVSYGVAMGNGKPEVHAAADYVTKSVSENGIVHALKEHGIL